LSRKRLDLPRARVGPIDPGHRRRVSGRGWRARVDRISLRRTTALVATSCCCLVRSSDTQSFHSERPAMALGHVGERDPHLAEEGLVINA
jgi:hypothetical protein